MCREERAAPIRGICTASECGRLARRDRVSRARSHPVLQLRWSSRPPDGRLRRARRPHSSVARRSRALWRIRALLLVGTLVAGESELSMFASQRLTNVLPVYACFASSLSTRSTSSGRSTPRWGLVVSNTRILKPFCSARNCSSDSARSSGDVAIAAKARSTALW